MLKRLLLSLAVLLGVLGVAAQNRQLVLNHEGNPTFFNISDMDKALEAAVANDTIFVPECNIPGFKITKPITILGTGRNTIISGEIEIELQNPESEVKNALLDGLFLTKSIHFLDCTTPGIYYIRFCEMLSLYAGKSSESDTNSYNFLTEIKENLPNLIVESCYIHSGSYLGPGVKSAYIFNSKIEFTRGSAPVGAVNYEFCNVRRLGSSSEYTKGYGNLEATFTKSVIIEEGSSFHVAGYEDYTRHVTIINCTLYTNSSYANGFTNINSQFGTNFNLNSQLDCETYPSIDGEMIGAEGGTSPYSTLPSLPSITQSSVEMDAENRLVKISLKIDGGPQTETPDNPETPAE